MAAVVASGAGAVPRAIARVSTSGRDGGAMRRRAASRRRPVEGTGVVVTGGSRGLGYELCRAFLRRGDAVVLCSRTEAGAEGAVAGLKAEFGAGARVCGAACDVGVGRDVRAFADFACAQLGGAVDVWVNNAGTNAYAFTTLLDSDDESLEDIVRTNLLGSLYGTREAARVMRAQAPREGHIFNMEGAGTDGGSTPRFAAYGATKRALPQLTKSINAELKDDPGMAHVGVHELSPGMMTTELLMVGKDVTPVSRFFINVLAETAEDSAEYLAPRVREVVGRDKSIVYLTKVKAYRQLLERLVFKRRKDLWVKEPQSW